MIPQIQVSLHHCMRMPKIHKGSQSHGLSECEWGLGMSARADASKVKNGWRGRRWRWRMTGWMEWMTTGWTNNNKATTDDGLGRPGLGGAGDGGGGRVADTTSRRRLIQQAQMGGTRVGSGGEEGRVGGIDVATNWPSKVIMGKEGTLNIIIYRQMNISPSPCKARTVQSLARPTQQRSLGRNRNQFRLRSDKSTHATRRRDGLPQ